MEEDAHSIERPPPVISQGQPDVDWLCVYDDCISNMFRVLIHAEVRSQRCAILVTLNKLMGRTALICDK
jgi:hypothetical protein